MNITEQEVRRVADLANLRLSDAETRRLAADLSEILTHIQTLNELDTSGVEPMSQAIYDGDGSGGAAPLRADCEWEPLANAAALANAPLSGAGYFKTPKVIER